MKAICTILFVISLASGAYAQSQDSLSRDTIPEEKVFYKVEKTAEFPGGIAAFYKFLSKNQKYPAVSKRLGIEGKVYVKFLVEKDGSISNVVIHQGINDELNAEAIRIVSLSPKWKPGMQGGRPVKSQFVFPVVFKLGF